jgi:hypothetical protein
LREKKESISDVRPLSHATLLTFNALPATCLLTGYMLAYRLHACLLPFNLCRMRTATRASWLLSRSYSGNSKMRGGG